MTRFLIADDHTFTLLGTQAYIENLGYEVVQTCDNGLSAFSFIKIHRPDIAILDIDMPGLSGLEILEKIAQEKINTKVIFLTMHKEYSIFKKASEYSLGGYLIKESASSELDNCIRAVLAGKSYLSKSIQEELVVDNKFASDDDLGKLSLMERKIVELIARQKTNKQIADSFFVSEKLIEKHRTSIIEKLNLPKKKNVLLMWALKHYNQSE